MATGVATSDPAGGKGRCRSAHARRPAENLQALEPPPKVVAVSVSAWFCRACGGTFAALLACTPPPGPEETTGETSTGGSSTSEASSSSGATGFQTVTSLPHTSTSEGSSSGSSSTGPGGCEDAVAALAAKVVAGEPCAVLVHLGGADELLAYSVACGTLGPGWSMGKEVPAATSCCTDGATIYAPDGDLGPYYVLHAASPGPDGVAIASNHRGAIEFDALTGLDAPGPIAIPTWSDVAELAPGLGCGSSLDLSAAASHDLKAEGMPIADLSGVQAALEDSALPTALSGAADLVRAVALRYAPQEGSDMHTFVLLEVTGK